MTGSEPNALIENLRRSNRRWKAIAIGEALFVAFILVGSVLVSRLRLERERERAEMAWQQAKMALQQTEQERTAAEMQRRQLKDGNR